MYPIRPLTVSEYPELLRQIPDAPKRLSIRGTLPPPEYVYLCVVGARKLSAYGQRTMRSLLAGIAHKPIAIVSGLAWGTDAEAHSAALELHLPTVAVLPSGLDDSVIYPRMNRRLAQEILAKGGALVSENPPGFKAMLHSFAQRNRVMAGMSTATLIIEAGEKSGTLITARLALDYNREVLAIPHDLGREGGIGTNTLLREGATLVRNADDILEALGYKREGPQQESLPTDLSEAEVAILKALDEPRGRDELIELTELSAQEANITLSALLIRGLIAERMGKIERI